MKNIWQLQDAKSKFSELVERSQTQGIQIVTRRGKKTVIVMSIKDYEQLTPKKGKLTEFLLASPLAGLNLSFDREKELPRGIEIEA